MLTMCRPTVETTQKVLVTPYKLQHFSEVQDAQLSQRPRCRVRYSFGQKWKTGTGRHYFTDIISLSSTTVIT